MLLSAVFLTALCDRPQSDDILPDGKAVQVGAALITLVNTPIKGGHGHKSEIVIKDLTNGPRFSKTLREISYQDSLCWAGRATESDEVLILTMNQDMAVKTYKATLFYQGRFRPAGTMQTYGSVRASSRLSGILLTEVVTRSDCMEKADLTNQEGYRPCGEDRVTRDFIFSSGLPMIRATWDRLDLG